jgi:hypothetical protein
MGRFMALDLTEQSIYRLERRGDGLFQIRCGDGPRAPLNLDSGGGGLSREQAEEILKRLPEVLAASGQPS